MVSAQPSQAPGMLAVGLAANRFSNSFARRSRRGSPRSSASNSSSTHAPDSLPIRARKSESKREFAQVYKRSATSLKVNVFFGARRFGLRDVYNRMDHTRGAPQFAAESGR